ncbi:MAG: spermidine synthase [Gemmatimonadota bacterium]
MTPVVSVFTAAVFLNAALLFAVQPMFTKMVLPLLGGTPSVWNTSLMTFQLLLLAGYTWAHLTSRWFQPKVQGGLHLVLLVLSLFFVPVALPSGSIPPPGVAFPAIWLAVLITISLGLPFFLLASGAPMLQRWLSTTDLPLARDPYVLYVASNLGSFVALLAYPLIVEPALQLGEQRLAWAWVYITLIVLLGVALVLALRNQAGTGGVAAEPVASERQEAEGAPGIVPTTAWRLRWVLLSFAPSSLLIGVTNYLSTDVAAFPLLWVVPLALYLLTFVIVFARRPMLSRDVMLGLHVFSGLSLLIFIAAPMTRMLTAFVVLHLLGFFVAAMVCHRQLADSRPAPAHLTEFYLWLSLGGALGGAFNVLAAPVLYDRILEYPFALIIAFGLRPASDNRQSRQQVLLDVALPVLVYGAMMLSYEAEVRPGRWAMILAWSVLGGAALVVALFRHRPLRLALGAAAFFLAIDDRTNDRANILFQERSFFGVYKVHSWYGHHILQHGTTTHGGQSLEPDRRREPLTYYSRSGPLGDAFAVLGDSTRPRKVALVGLGTGTISCYSKPGERWTYYEIDPVVVRIARTPGLFTYLRDCGPDSRIVLGDARLSLAADRDSTYDMIVLDAFSSDAIPVHLMTREALQLYLRRLRPDGVMLFHISNRYLVLEPVLSELAQDARLAGASGVRDVAEDDRGKLYYGSRWVALARNASTLRRLLTERGWVVLPPGSAEENPWTDDYSNVIGAMKWR